MINPTQELKTILLGETVAQINSTGPAGPDQPTPGSPIGGAFNAPKCQSIFHSGTKSADFGKREGDIRTRPSKK
jgi:hypothetical protein